ncbi:hypothetical protein DNP14_00005, partial [Salmonella enterica subsp. enterica serovar Panama]
GKTHSWLQPCLLKIYSHMVTFWGNYEGISQHLAALINGNARDVMVRKATPGARFRVEITGGRLHRQR